jgi:hypothetical protein
MSKVIDFIYNSMLDLAVIGIGQTPSGDDASDGLFRLNLMLDDWSASRANIYTIARYGKVLTVNKQQYQVGPGAADFADVPRPIGINSAAIRLAGTNYDVPIKIITQEAEWNAIPQKFSIAEAPDSLYYDNGYFSNGANPPQPYANFYLAGIPSKACTLLFSIWQEIAGFASVNDTIFLPRVYNQAIQKNLALRLASSHGAIPSDQLKQEAADSLAAMQRYNVEFLRNIGGQGPAEVAAATQQAQQAQQANPPQGQ